jgi:hypothetical protein
MDPVATESRPSSASAVYPVSRTTTAVNRTDRSGPSTASVPILIRQLALNDAEDQIDDMWVRGHIDPALAVALISHQAREFQLAKMMADRRQALPSILGKRPDILTTVGEQPQNMNAHRRGEHRKHSSRVLQQLWFELLRGFVAASRWGHVGSFRGCAQPARLSTIVQVFERSAGALP